MYIKFNNNTYDKNEQILNRISFTHLITSIDQYDNTAVWITIFVKHLFSNLKIQTTTNYLAIDINLYY